MLDVFLGSSNTSPTAPCQLPRLVVQRACISRLDPFIDAVQVESVITNTPCCHTFVICVGHSLRLAFDAWFHNVVSANGTVVNGYIPRPERHRCPFFNLESFFFGLYRCILLLILRGNLRFVFIYFHSVTFVAHSVVYMFVSCVPKKGSYVYLILRILKPISTVCSMFFPLPTPLEEQLSRYTTPLMGIGQRTFEFLAGISSDASIKYRKGPGTALNRDKTTNNPKCPMVLETRSVRCTRLHPRT